MDWLRATIRVPVTTVLVVACCVLAIFAPLAAPTALTMDLLYPDFSYGTRTIVLSRVFDTFGPSEFLRMLTPILLHGGIVHLLFNMMVFGELAWKIEKVQSSVILACVIVVIALLSNTIQYLYGGSRSFGGMSGVCYGLFGYIWMWQLVDPRKGLSLPVSYICFMLIFLVVITWLDLAIIADAAHVSGLVIGITYGAVAAIISRVRRADAPVTPESP